jgi:hypothetical protein
MTFPRFPFRSFALALALQPLRAKYDKSRTHYCISKIKKASNNILNASSLDEDLRNSMVILMVPLQKYRVSNNGFQNKRDTTYTHF